MSDKNDPRRRRRVAHSECGFAEAAQRGVHGGDRRDGQEALELAQAEQPDLLITDYHMPQLSGLELCQRLKQDPATASIPAIMLTARGYTSSRPTPSRAEFCGC